MRLHWNWKKRLPITLSRNRIAFFFVCSCFCLSLYGTERDIKKDTIINRNLSFGYKVPDSIRVPDVVVIHSSYCPTLNDSFNLDCILGLYKKYDVSAHYIIDREGVIYNLIAESNISYHGGKGTLPDGGTKINTRSIGIELINTKASYYTEDQYVSLVYLIKKIKERYMINYVLGHKDIAPERKSDPWNFDWVKFFLMLDH